MLPTNSGRIIDPRDQIFLFISGSTFFFIFDRNASTKPPFHIDRGDMNEEKDYTVENEDQRFVKGRDVRVEEEVERIVEARVSFFLFFSFF